MLALIGLLVACCIMFAVFGVLAYVADRLEGKDKR
jgi:hypothetical protein